jgi:hypothetical protein
MFSRIKDKLGTAGLIVAVAALIAALGGTALAALPGLNSKQKKEVTKIAKKFATPGPAGPAGATGSQGAKGDAGSAGAPGKDGQNGIDGIDGEDGENGFCSLNVPECKLPPGATLTGTWAAEAPGSAEFHFALGVISYPLKVVPITESRHFIEEGEPSTTECPGTAEQPDAAPGEICIYKSGGNSNYEEPAFGSTPSAANGLIIRFEPKAMGEETRVFGTWAVTSCPEEEPNC